ncbi:MAG TPA: MFS transporter [Candidatus Limnocylindrales bacterium]|nr:MFS transporter [Candidatus Limnocylindrales bacterium]
MTAPPRSLLRHADFLRLWSAETISQVGTQVTQLAVPLIAANILGVSAFEFGLLVTLEFLPFILLSLPAGVWVDRLRRRPILIVGDVGRALALISIPIAHALGVLSIWQLYVVGFVSGCLTVFFDVAYQSYLPSLVDRDQLVEGNAKLELSRSGAQLLGPSIAGVLIGALTAPTALLLDALSFIGSALFVVSIRRREPHPERAVDEHGRETSMRGEIREGLAYVLGHPTLRGIAATTATANLFGNLGTAILLLFLAREIRLAPEQIGFALSLGGVGFLVGALVATRTATWIGVGRAILAGALLSAPAPLIIAAAPAEQMFWAVAASGLLGGFGVAIYNINQVSFRQAITAERLQGRMNATMRFVVWGTIPIGSIVGGALGDAVGLRSTIWIGAVGSLVSFLPLLATPLPGIREMPVSGEPAARA